jgi:hypothetical protein
MVLVFRGQHHGFMMPIVRNAALRSAFVIGVSSERLRPDTLPDAIAAPGENVVLTLHAEGAQIYECKAGADGKLAWAFREPIAALLLDGKTVGRHYAGQTGSTSTPAPSSARRRQRRPGATANDIPWLKLTVTSGRGTGILSGVTTVQRINTAGGKLEGRLRQGGHLAQRALLRGLRFPAQDLNAFSVTAGMPGAKTRFARACRDQRRETVVVPPMPSARAAPVDRSMHRPFTNGPRSFIRTVTLRPVECEVTVT